MRHPNKKLISAYLVNNHQISKPVLAKLLLGLAMLLSLLSYNSLDPSPFNLLTTANGIRNWFGLPGALFSGWLFDFFGLTAYLLPVLLIFFSRRPVIFTYKHFLPAVLEILTLVSLVAILLSLKGSSDISLVGIWGIVSSSAMLEFPGQWYAIPILLCYQVIYFKAVRLDLSLFTLLWAVMLLAFGLLIQLMRKGSKTAKKSVRYGSIKWFSPLIVMMAKSWERAGSRLKFRYLKTRSQLEDAKLTGKASSTIEKMFGKDKASPASTRDQGQDCPEQEEQLLMRMIEEYRKTFYKSDSKAFLKLEEEI